MAELLTANQSTLQAFRNVFDTSLQLTVHGYQDQLVVIEKIATEQSMRSVESMMSVDGISSIVSEVFDDVNNREFYLTLQATFFSLMGEYHKAYRDLIDALAFGLCSGSIGESTASASYTLTPIDYSSRIHSYEVVVEYLSTNKWLLVYVLLRIWGRLPSAREFRDAQRQNQRQSQKDKE